MRDLDKEVASWAQERSKAASPQDKPGSLFEELAMVGEVCTRAHVSIHVRVRACMRACECARACVYLSMCAQCVLLCGWVGGWVLLVPAAQRLAMAGGDLVGKMWLRCVLRASSGHRSVCSECLRSWPIEVRGGYSPIQRAGCGWFVVP